MTTVTITPQSQLSLHRDLNYTYSMHYWLCPICLIHLIRLKSLFFWKKKPRIPRFQDNGQGLSATVSIPQRWCNLSPSPGRRIELENQRKCYSSEERIRLTNSACPRNPSSQKHFQKYKTPCILPLGLKPPFHINPGTRMHSSRMRTAHT